MGEPKLINEAMELEVTLRQIPLFAEFPGELMAPLVNVSENLTFQKDDEILSQNQMNKKLMFLIEGDVSVFVDGGFVGRINEVGSLLGEMSVIRKRPCSATLIADKSVRIVSVDTESLLATNEEYKSLYQSMLYCLYSHVLVEKLDKTNEKAKQFEATNTKLTAAQLELRSLNENLEEQVGQKTKALEGKVRELFNLVAPLKFSTNLNTDEQSCVHQAIEILTPLKDSLSVNLKLKGQTIIYLDATKKNHLVTKLALGGTGAVVEAAQTWEEAKEKLSGDPCGLVILDQSFLPHLSEANDLQPHASYLAILDGHISEHLQTMSDLDEKLRFIFRSPEKKMQIQNTLSAVTKILSGHPFGVEPYVGFGVTVRSERIKASDQRAELLQKMEEFFTESGVRPSYRDRARLVAEELLMNAIYDAPCSPVDRSPLYNHLPRTEKVVLEPAQQGMLSYVFDGTKIVLSVRDPFGALQPQTIYKYLKNGYSSTPVEINAQEGKGGAGRGLHQIVEASSELIFNLSPRRKTEVISIIYTEKEDESASGPKIQLFVE